MSETITLPSELIERAIESLIAFSKSDGYDEDTKQAHDIWQALEKATAAPPLFTEPAWLIEARAWLQSFRAAVEAAGLEWVAPRFDDDDGICWLWRNGSSYPYLEATKHFLCLEGDPALPDQSTTHADLPACVELYRRWLEARKGAG